MTTSFLRICALILGSVLFLPVSCTCSLFVGTLTMIELDARDISKGDRPHPLFYVIASEAKKNGSLVAMSLKSIEPSLTAS